MVSVSVAFGFLRGKGAGLTHNPLPLSSGLESGHGGVFLEYMHIYIYISVCSYVLLNKRLVVSEENI